LRIFGQDAWKYKNVYNEGQDVTKVLQIKKYDPQAEIEQRLLDEKNAREKNKIKKLLNRMKWYRKLFGEKRASFPTFIKKTDEDRIQLFPHICEDEKDTIFQVTEKVDGQSGTYFLVRSKGWFGKKKFTFGVCSRNLLLPKPDNSSYWSIARKYDIENVLKSLIGDNPYIVLQGEIIGTNIQGNKYGVKDYDFFAFNLIRHNTKYDNEISKGLMENHGIKFVPILDNEFKLKNTISEMVEYAIGKSTLYDGLREGVVIRNYEKGISFKVVSPEFLLKYGE
jgi:RNA ligase (TIGR02306 family)